MRPWQDHFTKKFGKLANSVNKISAPSPSEEPQVAALGTNAVRIRIAPPAAKHRKPAASTAVHANHVVTQNGGNATPPKTSGYALVGFDSDGESDDDESDLSEETEV